MIWAVWEPLPPQLLLLLLPPLPSEANCSGAARAGMMVLWPWLDRPPSPGVISSR